MIFPGGAAQTRLEIKQRRNHCIQCSVTQCRNHCSDENYCSLERIQVGTHESDPTMKQCTDCMSFVRK